MLERCAFRAHIAFWINGWQSLPESQKKAVFFFLHVDSRTFWTQFVRKSTETLQ